MRTDLEHEVNMLRERVAKLENAIERLQTPRAVLARAEELLRGCDVACADFCEDGRVAIGRFGDHDEGFFGSLADAYELLAKGKVHE